MGASALIGLGLTAASAGAQAYQANKASKAGNVDHRQQAMRQIADYFMKRMNVNRVNDQYGYGNSPTAKKAASEIDSGIGKVKKATTNRRARTVGDSFDQESRSTRQKLARRGMLNSGLDASSTADMVRRLLAGRQGAVFAGKQAEDRIRGDLNQRRLSAVSDVMQSDNPLQPIGDHASQRKRIINQAQSQIIPQAIGNVAEQAGSIVRSDAAAQGEGYQGLKAFFASGGGR